MQSQFPLQTPKLPPELISKILIDVDLKTLLTLAENYLFARDGSIWQRKANIHFSGIELAGLLSLSRPLPASQWYPLFLSRFEYLFINVPYNDQVLISYLKEGEEELAEAWLSKRYKTFSEDWIKNSSVGHYSHHASLIVTLKKLNYQKGLSHLYAIAAPHLPREKLLQWHMYCNASEADFLPLITPENANLVVYHPYEHFIDLMAQNGYLQAVKQLIAAGAVFQYATSVGLGTLGYAAQHGELEVVRYLLNYCLPPRGEQLQIYQITQAIVLAAQRAHVEVAEALIDFMQANNIIMPQEKLTSTYLSFPFNTSSFVKLYLTNPSLKNQLTLVTLIKSYFQAINCKAFATADLIQDHILQIVDDRNFSFDVAVHGQLMDAFNQPLSLASVIYIQRNCINVDGNQAIYLLLGVLRGTDLDAVLHLLPNVIREARHLAEDVSIYAIHPLAVHDREDLLDTLMSLKTLKIMPDSVRSILRDAIAQHAHKICNYLLNKLNWPAEDILFYFAIAIEHGNTLLLDKLMPHTGQYITQKYLVRDAIRTAIARNHFHVIYFLFYGTRFELVDRELIKDIFDKALEFNQIEIIELALDYAKDKFPDGLEYLGNSLCAKVHDDTAFPLVLTKLVTTFTNVTIKEFTRNRDFEVIVAIILRSTSISLIEQLLMRSVDCCLEDNWKVSGTHGRFLKACLFEGFNLISKTTQRGLALLRIYYENASKLKLALKVADKQKLVADSQRVMNLLITDNNLDGLAIVMKICPLHELMKDFNQQLYAFAYLHDRHILSDENRLLHAACKAQSMAAIAFCINRNIDVNLRDEKGHAAIYYAVTALNPLLVEALLTEPPMQVHLKDCSLFIMTKLSLKNDLLNTFTPIINLLAHELTESIGSEIDDIKWHLLCFIAEKPAPKKSMVLFQRLPPDHHANLCRVAKWLYWTLSRLQMSEPINVFGVNTRLLHTGTIGRLFRRACVVYPVLASELDGPDNKLPRLFGMGKINRSQ